MKQWMRTCQECLHKQKDNAPDPNNELSDAYRNRKCKKCKSEALDYGSHFEVDEKGMIVERQYDEPESKTQASIDWAEQNNVPYTIIKNLDSKDFGTLEEFKKKWTDQHEVCGNCGSEYIGACGNCSKD